MSKPSSPEWDELRRKVLGLGEDSAHKNYYPGLRHQLAEAERFRAAIDLSSDLIFVIDLDTAAVLDVNETACERLGRTRDSLTGLTVPALFDTHTTRTIEQLFLDFRMHRRDRETLLAELPQSSGDAFPTEVAVRCGRAGGLAYAVLAARDISQRLRAENEILELNAELEERVRTRTADLEASNRELEAFAYSISHDLRTPLRGIDGWSMALLEEYGDRIDDLGLRYLQRIRGEAQRIGILIDGLLRLSRITRTPIDLRHVDITELTSTIAARMEEANPSRRIEFVIAPRMAAWCDETLAEVLLTNLLENAVKFTGPREHARIEIGTRQEAIGTVFYVRDNGVGFDMAHAGILFGAFQRLHRSSEFPGEGIGLATVYRIIKRHGGQIRADAEPDRGATFSFTLSGLP